MQFSQLIRSNWTTADNRYRNMARAYIACDVTLGRKENRMTAGAAIDLNTRIAAHARTISLSSVCRFIYLFIY